MELLRRHIMQVAMPCSWANDLLTRTYALSTLGGMQCYLSETYVSKLETLNWMPGRL